MVTESPLRVGNPGLFCNTFSSSPTFLVRKPPPRTMQSPRLPVFCQTCRELTYREVRYRSDFQFVGRLLVCQNCGETILEPVGSRRNFRICQLPTWLVSLSTVSARCSGSIRGAARQSGQAG